ncbi:hypothetical protein GOP47_0026947, partial [Adiantum capillus-veneris]
GGIETKEWTRVIRRLLSHALQHKFLEFEGATLREKVGVGGGRVTHFDIAIDLELRSARFPAPDFDPNFCHCPGMQKDARGRIEERSLQSRANGRGQGHILATHVQEKEGSVLVALVEGRD